MREHKFRRLLKMECCKAMRNPFFLAVLAAGMLFAVLAALYNIGAYRTWMDNVRITGGNPMQQAASLYNQCFPTGGPTARNGEPDTRGWW